MQKETENISNICLKATAGPALSAVFPTPIIHRIIIRSLYSKVWYRIYCYAKYRVDTVQ